MENSRKIKQRWRKKTPSPESQKSNAQIRREWRTGKRPAPRSCFNFYGETTCVGCPFNNKLAMCKYQEQELHRLRRKR